MKIKNRMGRNRWNCEEEMIYRNEEEEKSIRVNMRKKRMWTNRMNCEEMIIYRNEGKENCI